MAWLKGSKGLSTEEANQALADLQRGQLLTVVDGGPGEAVHVGEAGEGTALRLVADRPAPRFGEALNGGFKWFGPARPASEVGPLLFIALRIPHAFILQECVLSMCQEGC